MLFEKHILPGVLFHTADGNDAVCDLSTITIKYFTAPILQSVESSADSTKCQDVYLSALQRHNTGKLEVIKGYYSVQKSYAYKIDSNLPDQQPKDCDRVNIWKVEEKQSDVNLALHAYHDVVTNAVDCVVIVTNDTDIAPALKMIREHHQNVCIGLVVPIRGESREPNADLSALAHWTRSGIRLDELSSSQLPRIVPHPKRSLHKPLSWYPNHEILTDIIEVSKKHGIPVGEVFKWMDIASPMLDNQKPIDMIETQAGAEAVLNYCRNYKR